MNTTSLTPFNGSDYDHDRDAPRLTDQMSRVFDALSDKQWHTLEEIAAVTGDPTPSISAQIRHLRKARFGSWDIQKIYQHGGLFSYRFTGEKTTPASESTENCAPLPPAAPELLKAAELRIARLEGQLEDMESFHSDVILGCDIDKGPQGLFRQKRVVIGPGKTEDEINLAAAHKELGQLKGELELAEAKHDELAAALNLIVWAQPAGSYNGETFYERFDGDGNYIGSEHVDPLSVMAHMVDLAQTALDRCARLDAQISSQTP